MTVYCLIDEWRIGGFRMKKDLTNSRLDRQNILNNEMAIEEIQNKSGVEGIVSIEGCIDW